MSSHLFGRIIALLAVLLLPVITRADFIGSGSGGSIPTAGNGISPPGIFTSDIVVSPGEGLITDVTVSLNSLTHTYVGDLIAKLTHVDTGTTVTLFSRVGRDVNISPTQVNGGDFGDTSFFNGTYSFKNSFTGDLWAVAAATGQFADVPGGNYFPTSNNANPPGPVPGVSSFTPLFGENSEGTWRLEIGDYAFTDSGSIGSWTLNLTTVPEPGSLVLGGLAAGLWGLAQLRRRRARQAGPPGETG